MLDPKSCLPGQEQYEQFRNSITGNFYFQYDFRTPEGQLFSCVAPTVEKCREKRDNWLKAR